MHLVSRVQRGIRHDRGAGIETIGDYSFGQMTYAESVREFKRDYWRDILIQIEGSIVKAAKIAGVHRQCVWKIIVSLGLENPVRRKLRGNWESADRLSP
jgi:DNA-binding NtrC family response regulator